MSNEIKMTNRQFLTAIIEGKMTDEIIEHAKAQLTALDARNEKRKNTPSKTAVANEPIKVAILEFLSTQTEPVLADAIFAAGIDLLMNFRNTHCYPRNYLEESF